MYEKTVLLSISLLSALLIIGLITGWIFRSFSMIFVGIIINSLPIVWFGFFVKLLGIPLSIEMLISMTISLGLASDATIHFAFKYFRSRYFGRTTKHSLEKMFFYSGIPVIFGSLILITIFFLLGISNIEFLKNIGFYSATLILLSLLSDLFILPIILLFLDKFNVQGTRKTRKHNPYLD
jgi:predicted RND superfamily exporter protein